MWYGLECNTKILPDYDIPILLYVYDNGNIDRYLEQCMVNLNTNLQMLDNDVSKEMPIC